MGEGERNEEGAKWEGGNEPAFFFFFFFFLLHK